MTKDTRKCPYCGEIIEVGVSTCKYCGETVGVPPKNLKSRRKTVKKVCAPSKKILVFVTSVIFFLVLVIGSLLYLYGKENQSANEVFGAVTNLEKPVEIISSVEIDEKLLKRYLKEAHFQYNKDKAFAQYVKRLEQRSVNFDEKLEIGDRLYDGYTYEELSGHKVVNFNGVDIKTDEKDDLVITSHYCPYFRILWDGEGGFYTSTNWAHLNNTFGKYLSEAYKEELKELVLEEKEEGSYGYYADGAITVSKQQILDRALFWMAFRKKYPEFHKKDVNNRIITYVSDLMSDTYMTWDYSTDYEMSKLKPTAQKAYEDFLKKADKSTYEYEVVQECYEILKKNGYYANEEFYSKVSRFSELGSHT